MPLKKPKKVVIPKPEPRKIGRATTTKEILAAIEAGIDDADKKSQRAKKKRKRKGK